jgi:chromate reductase
MKIFVYSASLRKESINLTLSKLIAKVAEANGAEVDFARMSDFDMPAFNMDDQQSSGIPAGAQALADRITNSDGMILTSPEYNWLPPATIKNAVDWLSRIQPVPLDKKSVLLSSASPSLVGGVRGLMSLRLSFEALGTWVYPKMFTLAQAPGAFDDEGNIANEDLAKMLNAMVADYCSAAVALNNR